MSEKLTEAVERLTEEVKTLHSVIEEFRVCFEWVANNRGFQPDEELKETIEELKQEVRRLHQKMLF